jgi:RHS repeat-associated protein
VIGSCRKGDRTFDALDRMVEQNRSGAYTQFVYAPTGFKMQILNGQTVAKNFVPLAGGGTAVFTSSSLTDVRHADWLGSSRFASTPSRTMYSDTAYAPFGEPYAQSGTTDLSFTGMNSDTTSGDYDFLYRPYSIQGRWPTPDPAGLAAVDPTNPQSWNRYAYVLNNPLSFVDPLGLNDCPDDKSTCGDDPGQDTGAPGVDLWGGGQPLCDVLGCDHWDGGPTIGIGGNEFDIARIPVVAGFLAAPGWCFGCPTSLWGINDPSLYMEFPWGTIDDGQYWGLITVEVPNIVGSGLDVLASLGGASGGKVVGGRRTSNGGSTSANNQNLPQNLTTLMEAQEKLELFVTNRILIPGGMILGGLTVAGSAGLVSLGACSTGVGCLALVGTVPAMAGGLGLAFEGGYYFINGQFYDPTKHYETVVDTIR